MTSLTEIDAADRSKYLQIEKPIDHGIVSHYNNMIITLGWQTTCSILWYPVVWQRVWYPVVWQRVWYPCYYRLLVKVCLYVTQNKYGILVIKGRCS